MFPDTQERASSCAAGGHGSADETTQDQKSIAKKRSYIELSTLKNGLYFTTVKLKELATEYQETVAKYKAKQSKLVGEIVGIAATYAPILEDWNGVIAHLDVIIRYVSRT